MDTTTGKVVTALLGALALVAAGLAAKISGVTIY
jgi:hypothetical protein